MHLSDISLEALTLPGNNAKTEVVIILSNPLKYTTTLKHLNLGHNNITDDAMNHIAKLFSNCIELQKVEIYSIYLQSIGFITLAKSLCQISSMKVINFQGNNIDSSSADDLVFVIIYNPCLEEVICGENNLCTEVIMVNKCLRKLRLLNNDFQCKGAISIAISLQHIATLKMLDLGKNGIDYMTVDAIAGAVNSNDTLQELWLFCNNLQSKGAKKIAEALQTMSTLKVLNLGQNYIRASAAHEIATAMLNNCIETLRLHENYFQTKGVIYSNFVKFTAQNNTDRIRYQ